MAKTLLIMRHAEAKDQFQGQRDFDRVLSETGMADAAKAGFFLKEKQLIPHHLYASNAVRCQMTAELLTEQFGQSHDVIDFKPMLYNAPPSSILSLIQETAASVEVLGVVAHNPGVYFLSEYLSGEAISEFNPMGIVALSLKVEDWAKVEKGKCQLLFYKDFKRWA